MKIFGYITSVSLLSCLSLTAQESTSSKDTMLMPPQASSSMPAPYDVPQEKAQAPIKIVGSQEQQEKKSQRINVKRGKTVSVKLQSNKTTGYQWTLKPYDKTMVKLVKSDYVAPRGRKMGAPGHQFFHIKALRPGKTTLTFVYRRPWKKDVPPAKTQMVTIVASKR